MGSIGRFMEGKAYDIEELIDLAVQDLGVDRADIILTSAGVVKAGPTREVYKLYVSIKHKQVQCLFLQLIGKWMMKVLLTLIILTEVD